jgi:ribA/ribD-fused uncharacterized protein
MIDSFTGNNRFLSNFYPSRVEYEGDVYPTVEHAFQAAKTDDAADRARIRDAATPGKAKSLGRRVKLRPDWERVKVKIMHQILRTKFEDRVLAGQLLATGNEPMVEGNYWNDTFWGVSKGRGQNKLGNLLVKVRQELRDGA